MAQYKNVITPKGTMINNVLINGYGFSFQAPMENEFDTGLRSVKFGDFEVLSIVDKSQEDPIASYTTVNGFPVKIGTKVNVRLTNDVVNSVPTELIIMTGQSSGNTGVSNNNNTNTNTNSTTTITNTSTNVGANTQSEISKSFVTPQKIIIVLMVIVAVYGILKLTKII